ncbi:tRNA pseudouridine(38-40) synthase TruA [Archaeoglobus veneficus]|nr:tRNA pseudouridine(38-40) synthase TruA [Archaeoglobus veneficus]
MRVALKLAYIGTDFAGFQYQPDERTVEGELFKAFESLGINVKASNYKCAGRTDAGVHAFSQVVALDVSDAKKVLPRVINANLPDDIVVWAWAKVPDDFNPRYATSRTYIYVLYSREYDISAMRKAAKLLLGTHDFTNFTKKFGEGQSCVRTIYNVELRVNGDFLIFEIEGNAFTWNMVRCIIAALEAVGSRHRSVEWFEEMLNPEKHRERIEPAPAYGLILKDIKYSGVEFEVDDYAWRSLQLKLEKLVMYHGTIYKLFSLFRDSA